MFERLLSLPILQGMNMQEISEALQHVRLDFVNYQKGDEIVSQGDANKNLICVINGTISACYHDEEGRFTLREDLPKTKIIEPFNMFGMYHRFSRDYYFDSEGVTLTLDRMVFVNHILKNDIVKYNMLNIVCNKYQKANLLLTNNKCESIEDKIRKFLLSYSAESKGRKELKIKMQDLADILDETRLNISKTLNSLQERGSVVLNRGLIEVPSIQEL